MRNVYSILLIFFGLSLTWGQETGFLKHLNDYIENTAVYEVGQVEPRAYFIPETNLTLNGNWKFQFAEVPQAIPDNFYKTDFNDADWNSIPVPSNWEMEGYGDKQFRNISTTFSLIWPANMPAGFSSRRGPPPGDAFSVAPPQVPDEYNPTGAYRKTFTVPDDWKDKEIFLRFEKVASASFVWINGQEVGYNEGAQEPSEYNITEYLKEGENTLAVLALKFSDGYYLEGQDYWRLSGIFDDVTLLATPKTRLFDWHIVTDLDSEYTDADLSVTTFIKSYDANDEELKVRITLEHEGKQVLQKVSAPFTLIESKGGITLTTPVENPKKWTADSPNLYAMSLELLDAQGNVLDQIPTHIGFKETEIIDNVFYLNGAPIKVNSMNSHMQHPEKGHVMDEETIRKDFDILKNFNFNSVRTSHYPPVNKYLELADEYGLYIIDEAGTEAHATEYLSHMPEYVPMYLDRVRKMVIRDRNHPSVLFWSAGNESGEGPNISKVIAEGKRLDPTRYWMYGGNADRHPGEDIIGPRYPTPIELEVNFGMETNGKRPSFMDEYLSIAGNGGGGLEEYWDVIYRYPRLMAGAIWDFVSTGITEPVRKIKDASPNGVPAHIMGNAKLVKSPTGNALDLNGHDQWVEVYRADPVEFSGDGLTLALDVYPRMLNKSSGTLITKGSHQFGLRQQGVDSLEFYIYTDKLQVLKTALPKDWENNWHNIRAIYNGEEMQLYIDGQKMGAKPVTGTINNLPYPINIGRDAEVDGQEMEQYTADALFDNVGVFDKAIAPLDAILPNVAQLWLSFEEESKEGSFYSIGIGARTYGAIWPDRTPQPEMWQMKRAGQPLRYKTLNLEAGIFEVWNRNDFLSADHWNHTWRLLEGDKVIQSGKLDIDVGPRQKAEVTIPYKKPSQTPGKEYILEITTSLQKDNLWAKAGSEVGWDQFLLEQWKVDIPEPIDTKSEVALVEDEADYVISGTEFVYRISRKSGKLHSMVVDGKELLEKPIKLNVWRAPLANELDQWNGGSFRSRRWKEGFGSTLATDYYSSGIHDLEFIPIHVEAKKVQNTIRINVEEMALVNGGKKDYTLRDRYISGLSLSGFESSYIFTVYVDGTIKMEHEVNPNGSMPQMLPRIGLQTELNKSLQKVAWFGRGPQENYPDRKSGYKIGYYSSSVDEMHEPYLIPQDNGLRTDIRWLRITDNEGTGLEFKMDQLFNFNVSPYDTENLTRALYTFQLEESKANTLNLDYATTGVGGTARPVLNAYRVYPKRYVREVLIRPIIK